MINTTVSGHYQLGRRVWNLRLPNGQIFDPLILFLLIYPKERVKDKHYKFSTINIQIHYSIWHILYNQNHLERAVEWALLFALQVASDWYSFLKVNLERSRIALGV